MRGKDLLQKMELADDKYIEETSAYKKKNSGLIKILAVAAAVALVAAAVPLTVMLLGKSANTPTPVVTDTEQGGTAQGTEEDTGEPIVNGPVFTAQELADKTSLKTLEGGTKIYTKVYAPSLESLNYNCLPVPNTETVGIYERRVDRTGAVNESEAKSFINKYLPATLKSLGISAKYSINHSESTDYSSEEYEATVSKGNYMAFAHSNALINSISFLRVYDEYTPIKLGGVDISVDRRQTDEEIISSLQPLRSLLCNLFDTDLPDMLIIRSYSDDTETDMSFFTVYMYDKTKNVTDIRYDIDSDYVILQFRNYRQTDDSIVSDGVLNNATVRFYHYKKPAEEIYVKTADARLISIEEAEELLRKGYVFGGHACPLCMAEQQEVSFDEYDKVGLTYFNGIPFYAFYKEIGKADYNSNKVYARTLVCAVEVSGYKEYFDSQKAYHNSFEVQYVPAVGKKETV